jgi:hypothetical protein
MGEADRETRAVLGLKLALLLLDMNENYYNPTFFL